MSMKVVTGIVDENSVNEIIDNLVEADFDERDISLIMQDEKKARLIIDDNGPLKGTSLKDLEKNLQGLGMDKQTTVDYIHEVGNNKSIIAVKVEADLAKDVKETLKDFEAEFVQVI